MPNRPNSPPPASNVKRDFEMIVILLGVVLVPWGIVYAAAWLAGGQPSSGPVDTIRLATDRIRVDHGVVVWHLVGAFSPVSPLGFWTSVIGLAGLVGGATFAVWYLFAGGLPAVAVRIPWLHRNSAQQHLTETSRYAKAGEVQTLAVNAPQPGRVILGYRGARSLIATPPQTNILAIGSTRSGKTTGLVIPNLLEWDGPAVVTSTKNELVDLTAGYRQRIGPIYLYDPMHNLDAKYATTTWSPLAECSSWDASRRTASAMIAGVSKASSSGENDWSHWNKSRRLLLGAMFFAAHHHNVPIGTVRQWVQEFDSAPTENLLERMLHDRATFPDVDPIEVQIAIESLHSIDQRTDKERQTCFSTAQTALAVFVNKQAIISAQTSSFNAREFLQNKGTLYLCTPFRPLDVQSVAPLFTGILGTVYEAAIELSMRQPGERLRDPLLLALDELANVCPVEDLDKIASQCAGRNIILLSIIQDFAQLKSRYGQDAANTILNNHGARVVFPGLADDQTTELLSKLIGSGSITETSTSISDGKVNRSFSTRERALAAPDRIRQLEENQALVILKAKPPFLVRQRSWYNEDDMKAKTGIPYLPVKSVRSDVGALDRLYAPLDAD